jgi:hypothetical protein
MSRVTMSCSVTEQTPLLPVFAVHWTQLSWPAAPAGAPPTNCVQGTGGGAEQVPATQASPLGQTVPQVPQLFTSVWKFVQTAGVPQAFGVPLGQHVLPESV